MVGKEFERAEIYSQANPYGYFGFCLFETDSPYSSALPSFSMLFSLAHVWVEGGLFDSDRVEPGPAHPFPSISFNKLW